ncbi:MAG: hypothetical protein AVDCRST_MAG88-2578 [uncultured Thermomicrobiales bacterium]|uniref:PsbP C-terminal domain-containing protein n=1 Tax=uncultured Thermomicrobiales bacterium TaxID=1645740 RepID=A0A6J4VCR0_9BACT|nr:MAG: hypothetical protein AVDCRST_MAG88-2578 [uncultured Thermomicrobiales bacterium]
MSQTIAGTRSWPVRMVPKDLGVALVVLAALALGGLLRWQVEGATTTFQDQGSPFRIDYPARWVSTGLPQGAILGVEDPRTDSAFKTTLTAESRELDPAGQPEVQGLVDRRVQQHSALTGYRLLTSREATVYGARGARLEYAYVAQPIDEPGRLALPVVVQAREYVVVTAERIFYLTLAAPQHEFADAAARFEGMIAKVNVQ